jgi:hypothetical protein
VPAAAAGDRPYVELHGSRGALDPSLLAPAGFDRVELVTEVDNHLAVEVRAVRLVLTLITRDALGGEAAISGWQLEQTFDDVLEPGSRTPLQLRQPLPARRPMRDGASIGYRVRIADYTIWPPSVELARRLIESPHAADQRAGLGAFDPSHLDALDGELAEELRGELAELLATAPDGTPEAALGLVLAIRAAPALASPELARLLLQLPMRYEGQGLGELLRRLREGSEDDEPRLDLTRRRGEDVDRHGDPRAWLAAMIVDALTSCGDRAVPELVEAAHVGHPPTRAIARRALVALGRPTLAGQLAIADREARGRLLRVVGALRLAEAAPALASLIAREGPRPGPIDALQRLGADGARTLVAAAEAAPTRELPALLGALGRLGAQAEPALRAALPQAPRAAGTSTLTRQLAARLRAEATRTSSAAVAAATREAEHGDAAGALARLDALYAREPEHYARHAPAIARVYQAEAERLFARGALDSARELAQAGLAVEASPALAAIRDRASIALATAFVDADELERAERALDGLPASPDLARAHAAVARARARRALDAADYARARRLVDRGRRALAQARSEDPDLDALDLRLTLAENVHLLMVGAILLPVGLLALGLTWLRRWRAPPMT